MDKRILYGLAVVALLIAAAAGYFYQQNSSNNIELQKNSDNLENSNDIEDDQTSDKPTQMSENGIAIVITSPVSGNKITSPLEVTGSVPGSWSFEGQFLVRLLDEDGNIVSEAPATLQGEWMTDQHVLFDATLTFDNSPTGTGSLVIEKSNPSGLPENDDKLLLPVEF